MKDTSALKPNYFASLEGVRSLKRKDAMKKSKVDPEDGLLSALSDHPGWPILTEYMKGTLDDLEKAITHSIQQGSSFEEIGRSAVAVQLCRDVINGVINKVNDAKESVDDQINTGGK